MSEEQHFKDLIDLQDKVGDVQQVLLKTKDWIEKTTAQLNALSSEIHNRIGKIDICIPREE